MQYTTLQTGAISRIIEKRSGSYCGLVVIRLFLYLGESIVVWKHGESVIFAGEIRIRKDLRIRLIEGTSLLINEATRSYAGK